MAETAAQLTDHVILAAVYGSSIVGRVATGDRAGRTVERVGDRVTVENAEQVVSSRCARVQGFSLHADVAVPALDRKRLERLIRYVARPPVATERLHRRPDGKLYYQFRKPWRDGTRGVVFTPTEFIEKLVALIPPPQANLLRYHGVLAPGSKVRSRVVADRRRPSVAETPAEGGHAVAGGHGSSNATAGRPTLDAMVGSEPSRRGISGALGPVVLGDTEHRGQPGEVGPGCVKPSPTTSDGHTPTTRLPPAPLQLFRDSYEPKTATRRRMTWRELLKRVFAVDVLECPRCRGPMKIIAEITDPKVIRRFLAAIDLPTEAPPIERARPPPQMNFGWDDELSTQPTIDTDMEYDGAC